MKKITLIINYAGLQLPVVKNDAGDDVTPLKPISDLFGLSWERQRQKVSDPGFLRDFLGVCTPLMWGAGSQNREQTCILVSRVAAYLMTINPERVMAAGNENGARYLTEKLNEWADALHDYELLGEAINVNHIKHQESLRRQRAAFAQMIGVKNRTAADNDRMALSQVIGKMASELGVHYQPDLLEGGGQ